MQTTLFVQRLKPGKLKTYKAFILECTGPRKLEYQDLLKRYSLNNVKMWYHHIDGQDYIIFTHDMNEDAVHRLKGWSTSSHPFDRWFNQQLVDCYVNADIDNPPPQPQFLCQLL